MTTQFTCPHCKATTDVDARYAGWSGPCHACGKLVRIPPTRVRYQARESHLPTILSAGFYAGLYVGFLTLTLMTLPEVGSLNSVLNSIVVPDPLDEVYHNLLVGQSILWCAITAMGAVMVASVFGILAAWGMTPARLKAKLVGALAGCAAATTVAVIAVLVGGWWMMLLLTPLYIAARLAIVLLCGLLGAVCGAWLRSA
jgi:hypothetical protein